MTLISVTFVVLDHHHLVSAFLFRFVQRPVGSNEDGILILVSGMEICDAKTGSDLNLGTLKCYSQVLNGLTNPL